MEISLIRKNSLGIEGTYRNAHHHAHDLLPIIQELEKQVLDLGFARWKQGHNVHQLHTADGRCITLRPFHDGCHYVGIRAAVHVRRSIEIPLMDATSVKTAHLMAQMLKLFAQPLCEKYAGDVLSADAAAN